VPVQKELGPAQDHVKTPDPMLVSVATEFEEFTSKRVISYFIMLLLSFWTTLSSLIFFVFKCNVIFTRMTCLIKKSAFELL